MLGTHKPFKNYHLRLLLRREFITAGSSHKLQRLRKSQLVIHKPDHRHYDKLIGQIDSRPLFNVSISWCFDTPLDELKNFSVEPPEWIAKLIMPSLVFKRLLIRQSLASLYKSKLHNSFDFFLN